MSSLIVGTVVAGWSLWAHWVFAGEATSCPTIVGVCVPFFLLLLICLETVGILTATIVSTFRQTEHAAVLLPHAMCAIGTTVSLAMMVHLLAS